MATYKFNRGPDDTESETATVETGFNTEELWENRSTLSDPPQEEEKRLLRSKSVGEQPDAPAATNIPLMGAHLEHISEGDESESFENPKSPEK